MKFSKRASDYIFCKHQLGSPHGQCNHVLQVAVQYLDFTETRVVGFGIYNKLGYVKSVNLALLCEKHCSCVGKIRNSLVLAGFCCWSSRFLYTCHRFIEINVLSPSSNRVSSRGTCYMCITVVSLPLSDRPVFIPCDTFHLLLGNKSQ